MNDKRIGSCVTCNSQFIQPNLYFDVKCCGKLCRGRYLAKLRIRPLKERFFRHVDKTLSCWLWTGYKINGYGKILVGTRYGHQFAHRVSWEIHHSKIPDGMLVCHACDTPACVNPDHLFLGTQKDNLKDMSVKGRSLRGEKSKLAILTEEEVREIRKNWPAKTQIELSRLYGVSKGCIHRIVRNLNWAWLK